MSFDDLLRELPSTLADVPELSSDELRAEFAAACRRVDGDFREQQLISDIADQFDADQASYAQAVAAAERGDIDSAVILLRPCAEDGIGEAAWLLAQLLEETGNDAEAVTWYERAHDDGDIRAAGKLAGLCARQHLPHGNAAMRPVTGGELSRPGEGVTAVSGGTQPRLPVVAAMVQGRNISRSAGSVMLASNFLAAPGQDLRMMSHSDRTETKDVIARLRQLLSRCPAGTFGAGDSALILATVARVSESLVADRDERAALRLIRAASPHLTFLGRQHPAAFEVRRAHASALCELGDYQRAEILLRRLGAEEQQVFGRDNPWTALLLLWALVSSGQLKDAETGFRALEARLSHPQGSRMLQVHLRCRYSWLLVQQGLESESMHSYDGVIVNRTHELGEDDADTNDARHSKGKTYVVAGKGSLAIGLLEAVAEDRARVQGDRHPDTLETLKYVHLARVQAEPCDDRMLGRAISELEEILRIQDKRHGPGYPMSHDTAAQLIKLYQLREAIRFHEPVPDLRQVPAPDEHETGLFIATP